MSVCVFFFVFLFYFDLWFDGQFIYLNLNFACNAYPIQISFVDREEKKSLTFFSFRQHQFRSHCHSHQKIRVEFCSFHQKMKIIYSNNNQQPKTKKKQKEKKCLKWLRIKMLIKGNEWIILLHHGFCLFCFPFLLWTYPISSLVIRCNHIKQFAFGTARVRNRSQTVCSLFIMLLSPIWVLVWWGT